MQLRDEYRGAWSAAGGVVMVAFVALATLAWQAGQGPKADIPEPAFGLLVAGALVGLYGMVAPLLHLRPFRGEGPASDEIAASHPAIGTPTTLVAPTFTPTLTPIPTVTPRPKARPGDLDRTPEDLLDLSGGLTDLQAESLTNPFIGEWMTVAGPLNHVGAWAETFLLARIGVGPPTNIKGVVCEFTDHRWVAPLSRLKAGEQAVVRGQIVRLGSVTIDLTHCELVSDQ